MIRLKSRDLYIYSAFAWKLGVRDKWTEIMFSKYEEKFKGAEFN
jgi:hypothetical protein